MGREVKCLINLAQKLKVFHEISKRYAHKQTIATGAKDFHELDYYIGNDFCVGDFVCRAKHTDFNELNIIHIDSESKLLKLQKLKELPFIIVTSKSMYPNTKTEYVDTKSNSSLVVKNLSPDIFSITLKNSEISGFYEINSVKGRVFMPPVGEGEIDSLVEKQNGATTKMSIEKVKVLYFWKEPITHVPMNGFILIAYGKEYYKVPVKDFRIRYQTVSNDEIQWKRKVFVEVEKLKPFIQTPF